MSRCVVYQSGGFTNYGISYRKYSQEELEEMKKENHVYSAAYRDDEIEEIMNICDHVVFNSFNQWVKYKELAKKMNTSCGIRINPECSTQVGHEIYDPCAKYSRMGITLENFKEDLLDGIEGLHFHT